MSADNGIYIHKFKKGWKVCHAQAIENIYWQADGSGYNQKELKYYFRNSPLYKTKTKALEAASDLHDEMEWTEYGIKFV